MELLDRCIEEADDIASNFHVFELRRRLNTHHSEEDKQAESCAFWSIYRKKLLSLKEIYADNREQLNLEMKNEQDHQTKTKAIAFIKAMEACISDDIEATMLSDTDSIIL